MSFSKQHKIVSDGRPKGDKLSMRESKVRHLREANTPDARKLLKKMNDKVYRGGRSNLKEWYKPSGKGLTCKP